MDALVLSGGNIKGSWQAGAIQAVLDQGLEPGIITGISVGSLNAAFLAMAKSHGTWREAGAALVSYWQSEVTSPKKVARVRPWYELLYRLVFKKWDGLIDTAPLEKLVRRTFEDATYGEVHAAVGTVDLFTGELRYTTTGPDFIDAVLASTAEPVSMPLRSVQGKPAYDGGMRDITPLKRAILMGATSITCVICQPENVYPAQVESGNLGFLVGRVMTIVTNEIVENDLNTAVTINKLLRELPDELKEHPYFANKREIPIRVIRPKDTLDISLDGFGPRDITRMIEAGRLDAAA